MCTLTKSARVNLAGYVYGGPNAASNAIGYAQHYNRSCDAVILVYDDAGNVIKTHENAREFKEP